MNKKMIAGGALAVLIAAVGTTGVVMAQQQSGEAPALTEAQAIEIALAEVPGDVQELELERDDGIQIYEIEILTADGQEMEVEIDASNGTILEVEADNDDDHDGDDDDDDDDNDGNKSRT